MENGAERGLMLSIRYLKTCLGVTLIPKLLALYTSKTTFGDDLKLKPMAYILSIDQAKPY